MQPFAGIRVVEFGQFVSVPFCAQLLADGGAEVIKIEAPEGDPTRQFQPVAPDETRIFLSRNRGKRSLPLRLREPAARPVLDALLGWADVVLLNFRPGLAEQFGLDAASLETRYPRLVVGSVTAFGSQGADAGLAGMDIVIQARSGLMAANGRVLEGRPAAGDPVSADYMCAMSLAFGVASALLRRERTGRGGAVEVSLMHAAMTLANNQLVRAEREDGPLHAQALEGLAELRATGASYEEQRASLPTTRPTGMTKVYFRTYETTDAVIAVACGSPGLRRRFIDAIGLEDPSLDAAAPWGPDWEDHFETLKATAEARLREHPAGHWIAELNRAGVPVGAVQFPLEVLDDPQALANGMLHDLPHPVAGNVRVVGPPVKLDGDGFRAGPPTAPLGTETRAILAELGFSDAQIAALRAGGVVRCEER